MPEDAEVFVGKKRYLELLGFTFYVYLKGKISKYSGMGGRKRTLAEFMESFIYGKTAEEAFKQFLKKKFGLEVLTEVDIADFYEGIYLPDIVAVKINGAVKPMKFWIDVKEVRRDQRWLLIPAPSVRQRPYDAYVVVWVGLPEEHVIWLTEKVPEIRKEMSQEWIEEVSKVTENISRIRCRICGFASWNDVSTVRTTAETEPKEKRLELRKSLNQKFGEGGSFYFDGKTALFDPDDPSWRGARVGENIGFALGRLERSSEWSSLVSFMRKNKRQIPEIPIPRTKSGKLSATSKLPSSYAENNTDYRRAYQSWFEDQLCGIEEEFGRIERTASWFSQPL